MLYLTDKKSWVSIMNERTDTSINNPVSILQAIDIPIKSRMLAAKIHMSGNRMVRINYVIIVVKIIMQVILVCVELRENLVFHVENRIILRLCAEVVKVPGTIFQNTMGRTFKPSTILIMKSNQIPLMKIHMFLLTPPVEN